MCGICGVFNTQGNPVDSDLVRRMMVAMKHRGPDGEGIFVDHEVALGHRRLSIIDLGGGQQPIGNEDDTIQVVFNGEIYNYVELRRELLGYGHAFRTSSDTEVIVHAYEQWGDSCVTRFNGMFSFALWDAHTRSVFIARDHLGIKPLYYTELNGSVLFASEIKALLQEAKVPRSVDLHALNSLFTFRFVPAPRTLFDRILKLPAGHAMRLSKSGVRQERFWNWIPKHRVNPGEPALLEEYQALLEDAVKMQLRSDVPLGLFLSSGIDSGALLAIMRQYGTKPVQAFTIGFEEGIETDEVGNASDLARMFGADHHSLVITSRDYTDYYARYMSDLEEPVGNESAAAFYFVSRIARERVKVALCGQGADEPWAGYDRYVGAKLSAAYSRLPKWVKESISGLVRATPGRHEKLKRAVVSLGEHDMLERLTRVYSFFEADLRRSLFRDWVRSEIGFSDYSGKLAISHLQQDVGEFDPLTQMQYVDTRANLPDDLLMVGDKTSMANSLEARVPFLDYRIVEFVESLPPHFKLRGLTGKYLHKKALRKWLPDEVVYRKKKGFANPVDSWIRGKMRDYVDELILASDSACSKYFNPSVLQRILEDDRLGTQPYKRHVYLLLSFELWHRTYISQKP